MSDKDIVSAMVVLRSASGKPHMSELITTANIAAHLPSAADAEVVGRYFEEAGFEVGTVAGTSFSIAAPASRFKALFGRAADGELPLDGVPAHVRSRIETVTFARPLDFGPGSY